MLNYWKNNLDIIIMIQLAEHSLVISFFMLGNPEEIAPPVHFKLYYLPDNIPKTA